MAKQFFDVMKRHSAFSPARSGFVAEVVEVQVDFSNPSPARFGEAAFHPHRFTPGRFEQRHVPRILEGGHGSANFVAEYEGIARELVAIRIEPREFQDGRQPRRNRYEAVLSILGRFRPHAQFAPVEINVLPPQRQKFPEATAGLQRPHDQAIDPGTRGAQQL